jgi:hypothetical protein
MQAPDIGIQLNSGLYGRADSKELAEQLRVDTGLRVESDIFDSYHEGHPFPPEVIVSILYTLFPLRDIYANILSSVRWEAAKTANNRIGRDFLWVVFVVRKIDEEGQILKVVGGRTTDPENIKDLIRQADEAERGQEN